ncbi:MAG: tRNA preQ1(34) S-adenosylmethionine ribosyltransferase-isomerase QueA [Nitrospirota bacterium]
MKTADFDFVLPRELIALYPAEKRDHSRLLVLRRSGAIEHRRFFDIAGYLRKGDMLLLNDTKVFPARIIGTKPSGGSIDILLVRERADEGVWEVFYKGKYEGALTVLNGIRAELRTERCNDAGSQNTGASEQLPKRFLRFFDIDPQLLKEMLWQHGYMPLPPYIGRMPEEEDKARYQTVYAREQGSIAAPTAGLHFTPELLDSIAARGVLVRTITLHVGPGTFKPVKAEHVAGHTMDAEDFEVKPHLLEEICQVREKGNRLITVGTTATRAIESVMGERFKRLSSANGCIRGSTDIFIHPGYTFRAVDGLITNFHLPCSTPLMLAAAFSGLKNLLKSYEEAISKGYRFFSYGDAMLIL